MKPLISVLIPTRNRREVLLSTLGSLAHQSASPDSYEVIVVADGCTDGTPQTVRALAETMPWKIHDDSPDGMSRSRLRCMEQEWAGASAARNRALYAARAPLVLFLDDDMVAHPGLIDAHLGHHAAHGLLVLGNIVPERGNNALHQQLRRSFYNRHRRLSSANPVFTDLYTGNVSLSTEVAIEVGGLDDSIRYGEDSEFGFRLERAGLRFAYAADAISRHQDLKTAEALLRDFSRSGQGCVQIWRKWPEAWSSLPFYTYRARTLQMRLVRALLAISHSPIAVRMTEDVVRAWANSHLKGRLSRFSFGIVRSYYFWRGVRAEIDDHAEWMEVTGWSR